jgi:hypothetical protein
MPAQTIKRPGALQPRSAIRSHDATQALGVVEFIAASPSSDIYQLISQIDQAYPGFRFDVLLAAYLFATAQAPQGQWQ